MIPLSLSFFAVVPPFLDPDPSMLPRPAQFGSVPPDSTNTSSKSYTASGGVGADTGDATAASAGDRALRVHHSSTTVLMLENALAAVRNDASQLPLSDLVHASTMIRDLESVLRERLARSLGDDEEIVDGVGAEIEGNKPTR